MDKTITDLFYDLNHLHALTETVCDTLTEMDYGTPDCRNHKLDRVASLCRIASDIIGQMVEFTSRFDHSGFDTNDPAAILKAIQAEMAKPEAGNNEVIQSAS